MSSKVVTEMVQTPARSLRVVVVDDNRDIVLTTMALLRTRGHEAKACYSGLEVLDCVREYDPDVVLLDIGLPGLSGWEVARKLREHIPPGRRPLLIAITGEFTKNVDRTLAKMSGFDYYLVKPADPNVLLALIEELHAKEDRRH